MGHGHKDEAPCGQWVFAGSELLPLPRATMAPSHRQLGFRVLRPPSLGPLVLQRGTGLQGLTWTLRCVQSQSGLPLAPPPPGCLGKRRDRRAAPSIVHRG